MPKLVFIGVLDEKCLAFIFMINYVKIVVESLNTIFDTLLPFNQNQQSNCLSWLVLIIFSFIADNFGRKLSSSISVEALLVKFDMNQQMLTIVLFFLSFRDMPIITVHYSFINELSQSNFREVQNVGVKVFFLICKFAIIALAYFITFWKWLEITVAIPYFLQIIGSLLIFESSYFYKQDQENMTSPFPYS